MKHDLCSTARMQQTHQKGSSDHILIQAKNSIQDKLSQYLGLATLPALCRSVQLYYFIPLSLWSATLTYLYTVGRCHIHYQSAGNPLGYTGT